MRAQFSRAGRCALLAAALVAALAGPELAAGVLPAAAAGADLRLTCSDARSAPGAARATLVLPGGSATVTAEYDNGRRTSDVVSGAGPHTLDVFSAYGVTTTARATSTDPAARVVVTVTGSTTGTVSLDRSTCGADPVRRYVTQVYADLFGRPADATGLVGWTTELRGGRPYGAVANSITASAEFRSRLISDSYQHYLHRAPDSAGFAAWLAAMSRGLPIEGMQAGFIASPEYYAQAGGQDAGWVRALYQGVLGRTPAPAEVAGWTTALSRGQTRAQVATGFLYSSEHLGTVVDGYYRQLLRRGADAGGQRGWVAALQTGARDEQIVAGLAGSPEYLMAVLDEAPGTWTEAAPLPGSTRERHTATLLRNGLVLVAGGKQSDTDSGTYLSTALLYDPVRGTWSATGELHEARVDATATLLPSGKVLVAGGESDRETESRRPSATAELYDPATGRWTLTGAMGGSRTDHTAVLLASGRVLVAGGRHEYRAPADAPTAELYDPATGRWTRTGDLLQDRTGHGAALLPDGSVLVAGGQVLVAGDLGGPTATAEVYDPGSGRWTPTSSMTTSRYTPTLTAVGTGEVLAVGGHEYSPSIATGDRSAETYDPRARAWRSAGLTAAPLTAHTATLLPSGDVLVTGGSTIEASYDHSLPYAELWSPATRSFRSLPDMPTGRYDATATVLPGGAVLVAGGKASASYLAPDRSVNGSTAQVLTRTPDALQRAYAELTVAGVRLGSPVESERSTVVGGLVDGREGDVGVGRERRFTVGQLDESAATGLHELHGPVLARYRELGGAVTLWGMPRTDVRATRDGRGQVASFGGGDIVWSPTTGAHELPTATVNAWQQRGGETGPLGYPTAGPVIMDIPVRAQDGVALWPTVTTFTGGDVYSWDGSVHVLRGPVLSRFARGGYADEGTSLVLGPPLTDDLPTPDGTGRYADFWGGSIYWTPATGAQVVTDPVRKVWRDTGGPGRSWLGYPIGEDHLVGNQRRQDFQGGYVYYELYTFPYPTFACRPGPLCG